MSDQEKPDKDADQETSEETRELTEDPATETAEAEPQIEAPKKEPPKREPAAPKRTAVDREPAPAKSGGNGIGVLAIFLALIATGIASYPAYMMWQEANQTAPDPMATKMEQVSADLNALSQELTRVAEAQSALAAKPDIDREYTDQRVAAIAETLTAELQVIRDEFGTSSQDWLFAEVEYLIRMANQRALMERDTESALQLLTSADNIVRDAEGLTAHALREALALDIAALNAVNQPDVQGIFLTLSAQVAQVSSLKRSMPVYEPPAELDVETVAPASWWDRIQGVFTKAFSRLAELVDFRRGDVEIKPILPPAEEYYLRQNLVLKLQMAQLALLDGDSEVFSAAVSDAAEWTADYFDGDDAATQAMVQTLTALAEADVSVEVPDISRSLIAVRRQLENFKGEAVR